MPTGRKQAKSRLEALLSMASGAVAEPVAGLAGLLGLATGGARRGSDAVEKTRAALTYQPRDPSAMQELGRLVEPITSRIEQGKRYLGDSAYNATGSPALAAAAYTAPEGLAALLGLRGAGMKGPTMRQMAQRTGELPAMGSPASQIGAINAWHGSPHDFDRFSMDRIGTGEGAQAYGHGLYFAGRPDVADGYKKNLSRRRDKLTIRGRPETDYPQTLVDQLAIHGKDPAQLRAALEDEIADPDTAHWARLYAMNSLKELDGLGDISAAEISTVPHQGRLYEVELAPDETELLDWDAPLSQQPEKVQQALADFGWTQEDMTGGDFYRALGFDYAPSPAEASRRLRELGIPGIRYLDGGSRTAGDGSRNYVMFDDSLVKIKGKQ